jgi:hypothetical protein
MKRTRTAVLLCGLAVACAVSLGVVLGGEGDGTGQRPLAAAPATAQAAGTARPNPVSAGRRVANVAFYYGGTVPLEAANRDRLHAVLGHPAIVVTTPRSDGSSEVDAIHAMGAKAYRYVQFYWAPDNEVYEGIDLEAHPDWAFCRSGRSAAVGRTTAGDVTWRFIDTNERAVRRQVGRVLAKFAADGWDGVFFDRGQAATQYAADRRGRPIWYRTSSCTERPFKRGATFADAYVNTLRLARDAGLETMVNNGISPFDPKIRMRPDPRDRSCRMRRWASCRFLDDQWRQADLVLSEGTSRPRLRDWDRTWIGNRRSERDRDHRLRTVALITTATLGGPRNQTPAKVYYQWARLKLFNMAVGVNTGNDRCRGAARTDICNRYGTYPELNDVRFGAPLGRSPAQQACQKRSTKRCVWTRHYANGVDVLNASSRRREVRIRLDVAGCRHVQDVRTGAALMGNRCVRRVDLEVAPWSGRPLVYSRTRF